MLEQHGFAVCAEACVGDTAVALAAEWTPDLCLVDGDLGGHGIAAVAAIARRCPGTSVVVLAASGDDDALFAWLDAGACGFLPKTTNPERLPRALAGVLRGEAAIPRTLVTRLVQERRPEGARRHRLPLAGRRSVDLTPREFEVLALLRDGLGTSEIAERLVVEPVTVRTHVSAVLRKLEVEDRRAALDILDDISPESHR